MMKCFVYITFILLGPFELSAQIIVDRTPINFYFSKIEFANLPEPEIGKQGMIFYTIDTTYLNSFLRNKIARIIEYKEIELFNYKFKKNKFRYTDYFFTSDIFEYNGNMPWLALTEKVSLTIYATKNKRKWNWRRFRFDLIKISVDTIYSGNIISTNKIDTLKNSSVKYLTFSEVEVSIIKDGIEVLKDKIATDKWSFYETHLPFNFNDDLIKKKGILNGLDLEHLYIKQGKEATVQFYCPVLIK